MTPLISVIIPTIARPTLAPLLDSIPDDDDVEVVIVADVHNMAGEPERAARINAARERYAAVHSWIDFDAGINCYGQPQRNVGMSKAQGQWLAFSQDDNMFAPDAFDSIRRAILDQPHPRPLLFKVMTWQAGIVWINRGVLQIGEIDADCIVVPNMPERLARWTTRYNGDWDFISGTVHLWQRDIAWRDELIASALPGIGHDPG